MSEDKGKSEKNKPVVSESTNPIDQDISEDAIQIIETVRQIDPKLFQGLSHSKRQNLIRSLAVGMTIHKSHSGPLPDPETLAGYKNIIENGAERIMAMAEKEQQARLDDRSIFTRRMLNQSAWGQFLGFIICMTAIVGGIYLSANGSETSGIATIISALVALAAAFLYSKSKER